MVLEESGADFFRGQIVNFAVEDIELFFWVLFSEFNVMLDLCDEFIVGLIACMAVVSSVFLSRLYTFGVASSAVA